MTDGGRSRLGRALCTRTPIATTKGWREVGHLLPGDRVYDLWGCATRVIATSRIFRARPVYAVDCAGDVVIADAEHRWPIIFHADDPGYSLATTRDLMEFDGRTRPLTAGQRQADLLDRALFTWRSAMPLRAVCAGVADTVCIQVADPTGIFRVGHAFIPTHNSEMVPRVWE